MSAERLHWRVHDNGMLEHALGIRVSVTCCGPFNWVRKKGDYKKKLRARSCQDLVLHVSVSVAHIPRETLVCDAKDMLAFQW